MAKDKRENKLETSTINHSRGGDILGSVSDALDILILIADHGGELGVTELADTLGFSKTKVFRLLSTLKSRSFVEQNPENSRYKIGFRAFEVGCKFISQLQILQVAQRYMEELVAKYDEKTNLAVLDLLEGEIVYIKFVDCQKAVRVHTHLGSRAPLNATALGKAFLASMEWEKALRLIEKKGLHKTTRHSIVDLDRLHAEIEETQIRGYAIDDQESSLEVRCVAAVIRDHRGEPVAALSISGPLAHISEEAIADMGSAVRSAADLVSMDLGYRRILAQSFR